MNLHLFFLTFAEVHADLQKKTLFKVPFANLQVRKEITFLCSVQTAVAAFRPCTTYYKLKPHNCTLCNAERGKGKGECANNLPPTS